MVKVKRRRGQRKKSAWSQSAEFKVVARAALFEINYRRMYMPKCGATAKSTGEPCRNVALANGRCRFHGGSTPRNDQWHVRQTPRSGTKNALRKWEAKVAKADKEASARRLRLKRADEAERAAYDKWLWSHPPGSEKKRAARRLECRIASQERLLPKVQEMLVDQETQDMIDRIAELKARRATLEAHTSGVFS